MKAGFRATAALAMVLMGANSSTAHAAAQRSRCPAPAPSIDDQTTRNRRLITDFADIFYRRRNVRGAFMRYVAPGYIQHNPGIPDGRDAAIAALTPMFSKPGATFQVKRIVVDRDLAMIHLLGRGDTNGAGGAVVDIYRIDHGRLVEHWDVLQPIPTTSRNAHPMF